MVKGLGMLVSFSCCEPALHPSSYTLPFSFENSQPNLAFTSPIAISIKLTSLSISKFRIHTSTIPPENPLKSTKSTEIPHPILLIIDFGQLNLMQRLQAVALFDALAVAPVAAELGDADAQVVLRCAKAKRVVA